MTLTMTREELIERLNEQLKVAEAEDAKQAKKHYADEEKALREFRERLKKAMGYTYKQAKAIGYDGIGLRAPSCPQLQSVWFKTLLKQLSMDSRKARFRLSEGSELHKAIMWLPESKRVKRTVCDD